MVATGGVKAILGGQVRPDQWIMLAGRLTYVTRVTKFPNGKIKVYGDGVEAVMWPETPVLRGYRHFYR